MFWKQSEGSKGNFRIRGHRAGGGHSTFFQVGVCSLDFRSEGLANWHLALKEGACELKMSKFGGLWTENFQIWRLVSWKMSKFGGLWAKIWAKIEAVEAKISKFSQKEVLWTDTFAWNGTLANYRRGMKRGFSGPHIPIPLSRSVLPRDTVQTLNNGQLQ